jgi:hypothetical protein
MPNEVVPRIDGAIVTPPESKPTGEHDGQSNLDRVRTAPSTSEQKKAMANLLPAQQWLDKLGLTAIEVTENGRTTNEASEKQPVDVDGRLLSEGNRERVAEQFKPLTPAELASSRALVEKELAENKSCDGRTSILDQIKKSGLSQGQVDRVLNVMAEVRESSAAQRTDNGSMKPEQRGSWLHAIGELSEGISSFQANNPAPADKTAAARDMQDAVLAGMLSDSNKAGWSKAAGGNFFTHHLDGALAADEILKRYSSHDFSETDRKAIVQAILEHQISPPGFMGMAYSGQVREGINRDGQADFDRLSKADPKSLSEQDKSRLNQLNELNDSFNRRQTEIDKLKTAAGPSEDEKTQLTQLEAQQKDGRWVPAEQSAQIADIQKKIANPFKSPAENDELGGKRLAFSEEQRALLRKYVGNGTENWRIPDASTPAAKISATVIAADCRDNYFCTTDADGKPVKGPFKIASLRGPTSVTPDASLQDANTGINNSARGSLDLMQPADRAAAEERIKQSDVVFQDAKEKTRDWLKREKGITGTIPYLDEPLQNMPAPGASAEEKKAFAQRPDVKLANEIQQHFAEELLQMRRFDNANPADMKPVRGSESAQVETKAGASEITNDSVKTKARFDELTSAIDGGAYEFVNRAPGANAQPVKMVPFPEGQPGDMLAHDQAGNFKIVTAADLSAHYAAETNLRSLDYLLRMQKQCAKDDPRSTDYKGQNLGEKFAHLERIGNQMRKAGGWLQSTAEHKEQRESLPTENGDSRVPVVESNSSPHKITPNDAMAIAQEEAERHPELKPFVDHARELLESGATLEKKEQFLEVTELKGKGGAMLMILTAALGVNTPSAAGSDILKSK